MSMNKQSIYFTQVSNINLSKAVLELPPKSLNVFNLLILFADQKDELDFGKLTAVGYFSKLLGIPERTSRGILKPIVDNDYVSYTGPCGRKRNVIKVSSKIRSTTKNAKIGLKSKLLVSKENERIVKQMKKDFPCYINAGFQLIKEEREKEMMKAELADSKKQIQILLETILRKHDNDAIGMALDALNKQLGVKDKQLGVKDKQLEAKDKQIKMIMDYLTPEQKEELKPHLTLVKE